jgi:septum formation protein
MDVPETQLPGEPAERYLARVVAEKLSAVAGAVAWPYAAILVADTIVVVDGDVLGKPGDVDEAAGLVGRLVGRTHTVHTGYAIATPEAPQRAAVYRTVATRVSMRAATVDEVTRYARTGEGLDKAGAYAAQGIGAFLIERIDGSYTNVIGLPACEVVQDLSRLGLVGEFPGSE